MDRGQGVSTSGPSVPEEPRPTLLADRFERIRIEVGFGQLYFWSFFYEKGTFTSK